MECWKCKKDLEADEAYEYRGVISCEEHHPEGIEKGDRIKEQSDYVEKAATEKYRGLDFGIGPIGETNRRIFKLPTNRM